MNLYRFLHSPGSWSVPICHDSAVLLFGSIDVISFDIMNGAIVVVAYLDRCIFVPDSVIDSMFVLVESYGFLILMIKIILG